MGTNLTKSNFLFRILRWKPQAFAPEPYRKDWSSFDHSATSPSIRIRNRKKTLWYTAPVGHQYDQAERQTGSTSTDKEFKRMLTQIIKDTKVHDHIPDSEFSLSGELLVVRPKKAVKAFTGAGQSQTLQPDTYEEARRHASGWYVKSLEAEWTECVFNKQIKVKNPYSHFLRFCKQRGHYKRGGLF